MHVFQDSASKGQILTGQFQKSLFWTNIITLEPIERLEEDIYEATLHLQELIALRDRYGFEKLYPSVFYEYHNFKDYILNKYLKIGD